MTTQTASTKCQNMAESLHGGLPARSVPALPRARHENEKRDEPREDVQCVEHGEAVEDRPVYARVDPEPRPPERDPHGELEGEEERAQREGRLQGAEERAEAGVRGRPHAAVQDVAREKEDQRVDEREEPRERLDAVGRPGPGPQAQDRVGEEETPEEHRPRRERHDHPDERRSAGLVPGGETRGGDGRHQDPTAPSAAGSDGSGSFCASQSLPFTSGWLNSCGPCTTSGISSKLWCGGGEGTVHSSVPTSHGFSEAFLPATRLERKLTTKRNCDAAEEERGARDPDVQRRAGAGGTRTGSGRRGGAACRRSRR